MKSKKKEKTFIAYSKMLCEFARWECWIITIVYILVLIAFDKDISNVCLASWAAYGVARSFYYIMARSDHTIQLLQSTNDGNEKAKEILEEKIASDFTETINETISEN